MLKVVKPEGPVRKCEEQRVSLIKRKEYSVQTTSDHYVFVFMNCKALGYIVLLYRKMMFVSTISLARKYQGRPIAKWGA